MVYVKMVNLLIYGWKFRFFLSFQSDIKLNFTAATWSDIQKFL